MKLSEYKGEQALDLLADIIEPASKIMADKEVLDTLRNTNKAAAIKVAIKRHKQELIEIMAALDGEDPQKYEVGFLTLPIKLLEILNDKELMSLFHSQGQTGDATSSGSASENTEE